MKIPRKLCKWVPCRAMARVVQRRVKWERRPHNIPALGQHIFALCFRVTGICGQHIRAVFTQRSPTVKIQQKAAYKYPNVCTQRVACTHNLYSLHQSSSSSSSFLSMHANKFSPHQNNCIWTIINDNETLRLYDNSRRLVM